MRALITIAIIVSALVQNSGWASAWEFIKTLAYVVYSFFVMLLPFLDIEQAIICKIVTIAIVQLLFGAGFWISRKTEFKIGQIVSGIADAIATFLLLIA